MPTAPKPASRKSKQPAPAKAAKATKRRSKGRSRPPRGYCLLCWKGSRNPKLTKGERCRIWFEGASSPRPRTGYYCGSCQVVWKIYSASVEVLEPNPDVPSWEELTLAPLLARGAGKADKNARTRARKKVPQVRNGSKPNASPKRKVKGRSRPPRG